MTGHALTLVGVTIALDKVETEGSDWGVRRGGRGGVPSEVVTVDECGPWLGGGGRWSFLGFDPWTQVSLNQP